MTRPVSPSSRPFYVEFAWAYDLLVDRPVRKECDAIAAWLVERSVVAGATVLDAGCGTGRYSLELARRGYLVHGIDASAQLLAEARRAVDARVTSAMFEVGDVLTLPTARYDAILCRGVLNDVLDDRSRQLAFSSFAGSLRADGVLILDVRDWESTATRKAREPLYRKRVETDRGKLTFTSVTKLDPASRRLIIRETHSLNVNGDERSVDYEFVMRCWTREELLSLLTQNGFSAVNCFGAYDR